MLTVDGLLDGLAKERGPLAQGRPDVDYRKVWDAFNRYVTFVIDKRQTLNVLNFCTIGWKVEEQLQAGKARLRPHFHLAENFVRAYGVNVRSQPQESERHLTALEEFNFSKAAIRFSQNLTKENVFMGLRAITQHLGDLIMQGRKLNIEFEAGRLICNERAVSFCFSAELYLREGLEVPGDAVKDANYKPSATFAPASKETLESLQLKGVGQFAVPVKADSLGGWQDDGQAAQVTFDGYQRSPRETAAEQKRTDDYNSPQRGERSAPSTATTAVSKEDHVRSEALHRHITQMEAEAGEAIRDKDQWERHLQSCIDREAQDLSWKRANVKEYGEQLKSQMAQCAERRAVGRDVCIQQASMHDFPSFKEAPEVDLINYMQQRREGLKQDLDQQVEIKHQLQTLSKQKERALEVAHVEHAKHELNVLNSHLADKKGCHREVLTQAWNEDQKLRSVKKAIDYHHKVPIVKAELPTRGYATLGELRGGGSSAPTERGIPAAQYSAPGSMLSPKSGSGLQSRPVTGSVRKSPMGAAGSLALYKERLKRSGAQTAR